jgi:DNA methylase
MSPVAERSRRLRAQLQDEVERVDWEQVDAATRYLTHDLHRYSGKFIPQIARSAIELISARGDLIVDPYAGSGTTVLEAGLTERRALGVDLNPLAVLIGTAKTTNITQQRLDDMLSSLSVVAAGVSAEAGMDTLPEFAAPQDWLEVAEQDPRLQDDWFKKWFEAPVLKDLLLLDAAIEALPHPEQRALGRVALSNILRKSSRAHGAYPNVMFDRKAPGRARPGRAFLASLQRCASMVSALPSLADLRPMASPTPSSPIRPTSAPSRTPNTGLSV